MGFNRVANKHEEYVIICVYVNKKGLVMKIGVRKRSFSKSFKARTTGKIKRKLKKSVNPLYGKKNINIAKNPSKYVKDKAYHSLTVGVPSSGLSNNGKRTKLFKKATPDEDGRTGHSLILHILLIYVVVGLFTIPYYSISKKHYWHA